MATRQSVAATAQRYAGRVPAPLRFPLAVYAVLQLIYLAWWAAFFPGLMSYDSITYVREVTTHHWSSDHSVLYDSFVWLCLKGTGDLWLLTLLQTVVMAAVVAYTCVALCDLGVRKRWSAAAALVLALLPSTGAFVVWVWKDTAFAISVLLAFAAVVRLVVRVMRGRAALRDRWFYWQLGLLEAGFLGIALFRNNDIILVLAALPLLLFALQSMRKWLLALAAVTTVVFLATNFVLYPALGIRRPNITSYYAFNYADIAVAYKSAPATFTAADKAVMVKVAPLSVWRGTAGNCWDVDWTMRSINRTEAGVLNSQLTTIWWEVLRRTPQWVAQGHLCRSQIAWGIFAGPRNVAGNTAISATVIPSNLFEQADPGRAMQHSPYRPILKARPLSDTLHSAAAWAYQFSETAQTQWIVWRGAFWSYMSYLSVLLLAFRWRRPGRRVLGIAAIAFGAQMSVIAANPAPLARYTLPAIVLGIMTVPLLTLLHRPAPAPDGPEDPDDAEVNRTGTLEAAATPHPSRIGTG
jgi:hypothetical protein